MNKLVVIVSVLFMLLVPCEAVEVSKWVDKDGKTHYGERPPVGYDSDRLSGQVSVVKVEPRSEAAAILYSTSWCGYCKKARAYMQKNNIKFQEYDIEKDRFANTQYKLKGGRSVPFLVLGDRTLKGFNPQSYQRFFGLN